MLPVQATLLDSTRFLHILTLVLAGLVLRSRSGGELHALQENWEGSSYDDFLTERRKLMAQIIRRGYETLQ